MPLLWLPRVRLCSSATVPTLLVSFEDVCVFITAGPITKLCAWGEEDSGGHVL
jgi:hypothetical protein